MSLWSPPTSTFPFSGPNGDGLGSPPAHSPVLLHPQTPLQCMEQMGQGHLTKGVLGCGWEQWEDDVQGCGFKDECWNWHPWCISWWLFGGPSLPKFAGLCPCPAVCCPHTVGSPHKCPGSALIVPPPSALLLSSTWAPGPGPEVAFPQGMEQGGRGGQETWYHPPALSPAPGALVIYPLCLPPCCELRALGCALSLEQVPRVSSPPHPSCPSRNTL